MCCPPPSRRHQAAGVGARTARGRRIDRDHDAHKRRMRRHAAALDQRARPQRVGALLDDLAVELLAAEFRAGIAVEHRVDEGRRQMLRIRPVPARVTAVDGSAINRLRSVIGRGVVVMTCRGRSPRRSPNCNISKVASAWRHLASSSTHAAWNCGPRRLSGSSAENASRHRAVRPFQPPARGDPARPLRTPVHRENARNAFDHHLAGVVLALADQCDATVLLARDLLHPFGAGAGLARAAAAKDEPGAPGQAVRGQHRQPLVIMGMDREVVIEAVEPTWTLTCQILLQ